MIKIQKMGGILCVILLFGLNGKVQAQKGLAGIPGAYLHMGVGARALGMGKAYTALADDPTALYWNPAGLAWQNPYQVYVMHSTLFFDTNFDFVAASVPTTRMGGFGFGILALTSNGFDRRSLINEDLGSFNMSDMAFLLNWSKELSPEIAVGVNYKLVHQRMLEFSGFGHGIDIGVKTRLFRRYDFGLTLINAVSPRMTLARQADVFPAQIRLGSATSFLHDNLTVSLDIYKIIGWDKMRVNVGMEYRLLGMIAVRSGFDHGRFTLGAGISFRRYGFDYSNTNISQLGVNHRFAVKYSFGGFGIHAHAIPEVFSPNGEKNISKIKFHVKTRAPVSRWKFQIMDENGVPIKQFTEIGTIPDQIVWDGRNDQGNLVMDGRFQYRFEVLTSQGKYFKAEGTLVSIDTSGPVGILGLKDEKK